MFFSGEPSMVSHVFVSGKGAGDEQLEPITFKSTKFVALGVGHKVGGLNATVSYLEILNR